MFNKPLSSSHNAYLLLNASGYAIIILPVSVSLHSLLNASARRNEARKHVTQLQADLREAESAAAEHTSLHSALSCDKGQLQAQLKELVASRQAPQISYLFVTICSRLE